MRSARLLTIPRHFLSSSSNSSASTLYQRALYSSSTFQQTPSPPRLPADQQAEFERLQRAAADRLADPTPLPHEQQRTSPPPSSSSASSSTTTPVTNSSRHTTSPTSNTAGATTATTTTKTSNTDEISDLGGVRRGAAPEFHGDTNPKTGEVGGPKNEPLRWGSGGDWSYNGRVTDF